MMNFFQVTPTELHLNGPNVGFTTVPQDVSVSSGIATFVAIGTATFPYNSTDGSFSFQWYFDGSEVLDTNSNASINTSSGISTLTLSGLTDLDNNKKIFSVATYIPGPDEAIIDYPAEGIGRSTSPSATLLAPPSIVISKQPTSVVIGAGNTASFGVEASVVPGGGSIQYQWNLNGINLTNGTSSITKISGADTPNLKIYTDDQNYGGSLKCIMTATGVTNSPLDSSVVSYDVVEPRIILLFEAFDINNNIKTTRQNLEQTGPFTITSDTFGSDYSIIQFTSVEKNSSLTLELRGAAGTSNGSNTGGEGGVASIDVDIKKNEEYTIIGVSDNSAVYLYEKSSLIAVVGQGGDASTGGVGGAGGGINVGGDDGTGTNQGLGGDVPDLNLTGIFGSVVNNSSNQPTLYTGDSIATVPDGGTTVICSKGNYYVNQGISPCSDISTGVTQFRSIDGTLVSDSSSLLRGFKPGYTVTETQGQSSATGGGNGGAGAQGGSGSRSNTAGGGGGSGWTNRTSSLVNTQLGGNGTQFASVIFNIKT